MHALSQVYTCKHTFLSIQIQMEATPKALWEYVLKFIRENVSEQTYDTWFKPVVFESFNTSTKTLLVRVPSRFIYEYLEENFTDLLTKGLTRAYGIGVHLNYRILVDKINNQTLEVESDPAAAIDRPQSTTTGNRPPSVLDAAMPQQIESQLNPHQTFRNFIEGDSNKLPRSVGISIAEHPEGTQFNPMFIYGPSGCGKTHLINAIGVRTKELYPEKRVLYISARLFQVQFTNAVLQNSTNDFINFYQTIDLLLVDDIQEWMTATKTQDTFFHIFNHLFRNGKRIVLACDRPPVELKGMNDRLLTRFSCGLIAELERPNVQLCRNILDTEIRREGLKIPADVVEYIAQTANESVRDLQGVVNSLMAYSVVYNSNIDMRLAERVIKRAVKVDNKPLTIDDILETVCHHFNVSATAVNSKSRKKDIMTARQVSMYLAQKYTKMPAARIGKLVGGRDHSTVIHSCSQIEARLKLDHAFGNELTSIEKSFHLKA